MIAHVGWAPSVLLRDIMLDMVTISIAFAVAVGGFALIWRSVANTAISMFGEHAAMTFTPVAYRPALDQNGNLLFHENGHLMQVPTSDFTSFEPRHERYMKIAEVGTTLSSASLIFVPGSRLSLYPHSRAFALVLLGFSVLYCVGFMAMLT